MEIGWLEGIVALILSIVTPIVTWRRGKLKALSEGKKSETESLKAITDFYRSELIAMRDIARTNLADCEEAHKILTFLIKQSCKVEGCDKRILYSYMSAKHNSENKNEYEY